MNTLQALLLITSATLSNTALATDQINVYGWPAGKSVFDRLSPEFTAHTGLEVIYNAVSNPYRENVEQELIYNDSVDVVALFSMSTNRIINAGWIVDLSNDPLMVEIADQHYPHLRDAIYTDGKLLGLGLAAGLYAVPVVNLDEYQKLGLSRKDFPKDWDDLYQQVDRLAGEGHRDFFYPAWFDHKFGLSMSFIAEVMNRGGNIVHPVTESVAMAEDSGPAYETLLDWRRAWDSGAIPHTLIKRNYETSMQHFAKSNYAIAVQASDVFIQRTLLNPLHDRPITLVPHNTQPWGTVIIGLFSQANKDGISSKETAQARDLLAWISHGKGEHNFNVMESWLDNFGYLPVNKAFMESDRARDILESKLGFAEDVDVLFDVYENASVATTLWKIQWQDEFVTELLVALQDYLVTPSLSPEQTIARLNNKIVSLRKDYGY